jgi:hypothetical protein
MAALAGLTIVLSGAPALAQTFRWINTGIEADWEGNDAASATGRVPRYTIEGGTVLCGAGKAGAIAICWSGRAGGYPEGVPTNIQGRPTQWCVYKNSNVTIQTPPSDTGRKGRVYMCGPIVNP